MRVHNASDWLSSHLQYLTISEFSGAFGDLATLIPIVVALAVNNQISLSWSLIFGGIFNIVGGLWFDIPMCVQPMKSIAGIALLAKLEQGEIMAAGIIVSSVILLGTVSKLLGFIAKLIPMCMVRGIQRGTGLVIFIKGSGLIQTKNTWIVNLETWSHNYWVVNVAAIGVFLLWRSKYSFMAITILLFGLLGSALTPDRVELKFGSSFQGPIVPSVAQFGRGFLNAALGQLPLSILNSVIAVSVLAQDLYPDKIDPAPIQDVGYFLGIMNLIGGWFGCVPYCCGSGGLAGQFRFGSRSGLSVIVLGVIKLLAGALFGDALLVLFKSIPNSALGVLLCVAGLQLMLVSNNLGPFKTEIEAENASMVATFMALVEATFQNAGLGFLSGLVLYLILKFTSTAIINGNIHCNHEFQLVNLNPTTTPAVAYSP